MNSFPFLSRYYSFIHLHLFFWKPFFYSAFSFLNLWLLNVSGRSFLIDSEPEVLFISFLSSVFYSYAIIPTVLNLFHLRFPDFLSISDVLYFRYSLSGTSILIFFQSGFLNQIFLSDFLISLFCFGIFTSSCPESYCFKSDEFNLINSEILTKSEFVLLDLRMFSFLPVIHFFNSYSVLWIFFWIWLSGYYKIFLCCCFHPGRTLSCPGWWFTPDFVF